MKQTLTNTRMAMHGIMLFITLATWWATAGKRFVPLGFAAYVLGAMTDATARRVGIWRGR